LTRPFYRSGRGLRFECTQCGNCCTRPGPVYFSGPDLGRAAAHLGLSETQFRGRYHVVTLDGVAAIDPGDQSPCIFHDEEQGCTIYEGRPTQCRTWPFWPEIVFRRRSWDKAATDCEGMNRGRRHRVEEIEQAVFACRDAGLPEGDPW
jgi:Fe-S-cluster containining protein